MEFVFANSGYEAMDYPDHHNHEGMLILSDINMPGMSGLELLRNIKQKFEDPSPVVMMITAYRDEHNCKQAINLGAADLITKPVDFNVLKEKIKIKLYG